MMTTRNLTSFDNHVKTKLAYKYNVENLLGIGGMANVYKALQKGLDREVAIKVIHPSLVHDQESVDRFRLEAKSAAKLNHPNIITIYDVDEVEDIVFICLEYLEGQDLSAHLSTKQTLGVDEVVEIMLPIAEALHHIHKKGLIHRDIKSSNIYLTNQKKPVLMDFGIASLKESSSGITLPGTVIGTPEYMSPEQANGEKLGPESDIYSLGIVMYQCLSGTVPFSGESPISTIIKICTGNPPDLDKALLKVPDWLYEIIFTCLSKDPTKRYRSALDLKQALQNGGFNSAATQKMNHQVVINSFLRQYKNAATVSEKINLIETAPKNVSKYINLQDELSALNQLRRKLMEQKEDWRKEQTRGKEIDQLLMASDGKANISIEPYLLNSQLFSGLHAASFVVKTIILNYTTTIAKELEGLKEETKADERTKRFEKLFCSINGCLELYASLSSKISSEEGKAVAKKIQVLVSDFLSKLERSLASDAPDYNIVLSNLLKNSIHQLAKPSKNQAKFHALIMDILKTRQQSLITRKDGKPVEDAPHTGAGKAIKTEFSPEAFPDTDKPTEVNFDALFNQFINTHIIGSTQVRELLITSENSVIEIGISRILYLFYSPQLQGNGYSLILDKSHLLKDKLKAGSENRPQEEIRFLLDGKEVDLKNSGRPAFNLYAENGKTNWDNELKQYLQKLKTSIAQNTSSQKHTAVLHHNFNQLLVSLKPFLFYSIVDQ